MLITPHLQLRLFAAALSITIPTHTQSENMETVILSTLRGAVKGAISGSVIGGFSGAAVTLAGATLLNLPSKSIVTGMGALVGALWGYKIGTYLGGVRAFLYPTTPTKNNRKRSRNLRKNSPLIEASR